MRYFMAALFLGSILLTGVSGHTDDVADAYADIYADYSSGTGVALEEERAEIKGRVALYADYNWMYDRLSDYGNSNGGEASEVVLWPLAKNKWVSFNFGYSASDNRVFFAPMVDLQRTIFDIGGDSWSVKSDLELGAHINYDVDDQKFRWGVCAVSVQVAAVWRF